MPWRKSFKNDSNDLLRVSNKITKINYNNKLIWKHLRVEPTQEEIDCFRQRLQSQADAWIETQEKYLTTQIECIQNRISEKINAWEAKSVVFVGKIKEQFNKCVASKDTKLVEYKKCSDERITAQRARLEKNLNRVSKCFFVKINEKKFNKSFYL